MTVVASLLVGGVATSLSEYRQPGWFYSLAGAWMDPLQDIQGDGKLARENRRLTAGYARVAAGWTGVSRVSWPSVTVAHKLVRLDLQKAQFSVIIPEGQESWHALASGAVGLTQQAKEHDLLLRVILTDGRNMLSVDDTATDEGLFELVSLYKELLGAEGVLQVGGNFGTFGSDQTVTSISVKVDRPELIETFEAAWSERVKSTGMQIDDFRVIG